MMARVHLCYGPGKIEVEVPDANLLGVVRMRPVDPLTDPAGAVKRGLENLIGCPSLAEIARGRSSACVVISDVTRPVPNTLLLPPLLETLERAGVRRDKITILIATGIHRPNLGDELVGLVGSEVASVYRIVNHYSEHAEDHRFLGRVDDIPIYLNKTYLDSDLKILTGLVELHLMAGYSGGRKSILPGIASLETMKRMHGYRMIQQDGTANGRLDDNPFHLAAVKVARMAGVDFILNVTLDEARRVTGVFAGELEAAHLKAVELVAGSARVEIPEAAEIVLTSGGGVPLDNTLYQTFKAVAGCLGAIQEGGTMIIAARNAQGSGSPEFTELLRSLNNYEHFYELVKEADYIRKDQWMIQELCNGLHRCRILYYAEGLSPEDIRDFLLEPVNSIQEGLDIALARHGPSAKVLVIPDGPYVFPHLKEPIEGLYSWQTTV